MGVFGQLVLTSARRQMAYRVAMWAGLATNLFFGLLRAAVILALYGSQESVNGLSLSGAITFIGLTQALIAFTTIFGSFDIIKSVYSGDISSDLLRPLSFYRYWLGRDLGGSLVNLVTRGLIFMGLFAIFYPVLFPENIAGWLGFTISLALSWLVSFSWRFLVNLSAFWTPDAVGIGRGLFGLAQILSGFFIPLRLMPDWFIKFCAFTPFPSMMNTPVEVYLGVLTGWDMIRAISFQALWLFLLIMICQIVYRAGLQRLVIQGG